MVALPTPVPVTFTLAVVDPAVNATVAGTVATAVFEELSVKLRPPVGAGAEMVRTTGVGVDSGMVVEGGKDAVSETLTVRMSGANPAAEAVMVVEPYPTPVICGLVEGSLVPAGTTTLGVTVATAVLLLLKLTVTPPVGATTPRLKARLDVWPGATVGS